MLSRGEVTESHDRTLIYELIKFSELIEDEPKPRPSFHNKSPCCYL